METWMHWIGRVVFRRGDDEADADASVEHVDAQRLAASEFRASATMRLDASQFDEQTETLPFGRRMLPTEASRPWRSAA